MAAEQEGVAILGIFAADLVFRASRQPAIGETLLGSGFHMSPGGKGSNQAVAAARAGTRVCFISKIGQDAFGDMALAAWTQEGIIPRVVQSSTEPTGAACIFVNEVNGENAIIVVPGAASTIGPDDIDGAADAITASKVFVTQLEQPIAAARRGLEIAKASGVITLFNPAPAAPLPDDIYPLCDYVIPNESEAAGLTGVTVASADDARRAGDILLKKGARAVLITLGEKGAVFHQRERSVFLAAFFAGRVVDTVGAGDAFVGAFAAGLARDFDPLDAARFASAAAGISVTRNGAAAAMPSRAEIERLLAQS
ncbi:MAG: ribokinase [Rhizobiales bacterium]|nr:ribokinase [Hyphomicrobiales bacterium]